MIVQIHGTGFQNKGAELMMLAIINEVNEAYDPGISTVKTRVGSKSDRRKVGLYHLLDWEFSRFPAIRPLVSKMTSLIPKPILSRTHSVPGPQVNAILDASGFAYGDQWGPEKSEILEVLSRRWKHEGKKIVLMPQAFGPFDNKKILAAMKNIIRYVDLIYARDEESYNHLVGIGLFAEKIKIAPDFTVLLEGSVPDKYMDLKNRPSIVPNINMIEKTSREIGRQYTNFLGFCIIHLRSVGQDPFVLIHSTDKDAELVKSIESVVGFPIKVIIESNALYLKGIIGQCNIAIGSRYHGLASALSQATPCLGTSWSHKYKFLFLDYEFQNFLVSPSDPEIIITDKIKSLLDESNRKTIIDELSQISLYHHKLARNMWSEIHSLLKDSG